MICGDQCLKIFGFGESKELSPPGKPSFLGKQLGFSRESLFNLNFSAKIVQFLITIEVIQFETVRFWSKMVLFLFQNSNISVQMIRFRLQTVCFRWKIVRFRLEMVRFWSNLFNSTLYVFSSELYVFGSKWYVFDRKILFST